MLNGAKLGLTPNIDGLQVFLEKRPVGVLNVPWGGGSTISLIMANMPYDPDPWNDPYGGAAVVEQKVMALPVRMQNIAFDRFTLDVSRVDAGQVIRDKGYLLPKYFKHDMNPINEEIVISWPIIQIDHVALLESIFDHHMFQPM